MTIRQGRLAGQSSDIDELSARFIIADTQADLLASRKQDRLDGAEWLDLDTGNKWIWDAESTADETWAGVLKPTGVTGAGRFLAMEYRLAATLTNGTVTVTNARVKASSLIIPVHATPAGAALGALNAPAASINAAAGSFIVNATDPTDAAGLVDDDSTIRILVKV